MSNFRGLLIGLSYSSVETSKIPSGMFSNFSFILRIVPCALLILRLLFSFSLLIGILQIRVAIAILVSYILIENSLSINILIEL